MKLLQHVYLVGGGAFEYSHPNDCNVYLIDGGKELALIDTGGGAGVNAIFNNIIRLGLNPEKIKVIINTHSHFDHIGGNGKVKELTKCSIAVHEAEAKAVEQLDPALTFSDMARQRGFVIEPVNVDIVLKDGDKMNVGDRELIIIHTPGHSPGSICILIESERKKVLFTGDCASAQGRLNYMNIPGFNLEAWKASLKKLLALNVDALMPGHGTFVLSRGHDHIKFYSDKINAPWVNITTPIDFQPY